MSGSTINYRPEIDGLRTIAVLSVIIFHAEFLIDDQLILSGGFLGVDVSFVISGYLISSIIIKGLDSGQFSFSGFYERRARRILPILFAVTLISIPFAWWLMLPQELVEYAWSIVSAFFFSSNFWFWSEDPYWATNSLLKPFLHTWSLAVEEQFYLLMPLLLIGLRKVRFEFALLTLIGFATASLAFAHWASEYQPEFNFYLLPSRIWELMAGSILALIEIRRGSLLTGKIASVLPVAGLIAILIPMCMYDEKTPHPSLWTVIPVIGTCAIIASSGAKDAVTRLLSSQAFVGIGLLSYGLYIWHYPVFAFGRMLDSEPGNLIKVVWITLTFALTGVTYTIIEKPYRNPQRIKLRQFTVQLITVAILFLLFCVGALSSNGYSERFDSLFRLYGAAEPSNEILRAESWTYSRAKREYRDLDKINVLLVGDSHAKDIFNIFELSSEHFGHLDVMKSPFETSHSDWCFAKLPKRLSQFKNRREYKDADVILISEKFIQPRHFDCLEAFLSDDDIRQKPVLLMSLTNIVNVRGRERQALADVLPAIRESDYFADLYFKRSGLWDQTYADLYLLMDKSVDLQKVESMAYANNASVVDNVNTRLREIADRSGIPFLEKADYLCDATSKTCPLFDSEGHKLFYDREHLTTSGALFFGHRIAKLGWFSEDQLSAMLQ